MVTDRPASRTPRALVVLLAAAAIVVAIAGIKAVAWLAAPTLLALVIVITLSPAHGGLRRFGFPRWAATAALVVFVYGILVAFCVAMIVSVAQLAELLPRYGDRITALYEEIAGVLAEFGAGPAQVREIFHSLDPGELLSYAGSLLADLTGVTTSLVFLLGLLLFLSAETADIDDRIAGIAGERARTAEALRDFGRRVRVYLAVTTVFGLLVAAIDVLALVLLGVPLAALWGLLSFVTNYIPTIGFLLGLGPPATLALLDGGWRVMAAVVVVYIVINFVLQSLIQPRYVGNAVGLSATATFVALVFWAWVLGPLGTLLSVPATLLALAVLVDDPRRSWITALVGSPRRGPAGDQNRMSTTKKRHATMFSNQPWSFVQSRTAGMSRAARRRKRR
ncbi:AI-2E family transporter [Amycolatopsis sp. WAC 01376]|uniref:AI-2E family transporter n=1 Tax=Amycolatopsis sp. WAC 01376 TaxID=2203195 RepID=UPI000F77B066|nr:AI-2E family transporter [Amycolatopsis sp. WAC 01376]RSM60952.1 AI-2E family transporter [Amycolatopsis sp. WAC 01376]